MADPVYPLSPPLGAIQQVVECISTGLKNGDLLGHLKQHKQEFGYATWLVGGYIRQVTIGMPGSDVVFSSNEEWVKNYARLKNLYAEAHENLATGSPDWGAILVWLAQLLVQLFG